MNAFLWKPLREISDPRNRVEDRMPSSILRGEMHIMAEHIVTNTMLNAETIRLDGGIRMAAK
jgi:hypothetical protein